MRRPRLLAAVPLACLVACSSPESSDERTLPCDVAAALHDACQPCHSSTPKNGAPLSLMTYADTQAPYTALPTYDGVATWKVMNDTMQAGLMPQAWPGVSWSSEQRETILKWTAAGAPPGPEGVSCP